MFSGWRRHQHIYRARLPNNMDQVDPPFQLIFDQIMKDVIFKLFAFHTDQTSLLTVLLGHVIYRFMSRYAQS